MDGGFTYGDIIVIAAIVAFILLRYRAMLGENRGRDPREIKPIAEYERIIQLPAKPAAEAAPKIISPEQYGAQASTFVSMRSIDREFSPEEFVSGARAAYEMVHEAMNKADRDTLKMLLSPELYKSFERHLNDTRKDGRVPETVLVALGKANVAEASLSGSKATIVVEFLSDQIHLVRDAEGKIIEGNPSQQEQVEDRWVFTRTLTNPDPNWKIIET